VAEDLAESLPAAAKPRAATKRRRGALRGRFLAAYLVLGLIGGAAIAGAFVLFTETERPSTGDWAAWHPVGDEATWPRQIADHVARRYRTADGDQIAGVVTGAPEVQGPESAVKVAAILLQAPNATSADDATPLPTDHTAMYLFCGLDDSCTVVGTASEERHRLLRREALELALYSFKYLDSDNVVALLPPPKGSAESPNAVFFERGDLEDQLQRPIVETIGQPDRPTLVEVPELETVRVDRLTLPFTFEYQFAGLPNQTAALILSPVKSSG
jgi:hypothetical protein